MLLFKSFLKITAAKQKDLNSFYEQQVLHEAVSILDSSGFVLVLKTTQNHSFPFFIIGTVGV